MKEKYQIYFVRKHDHLIIIIMEVNKLIGQIVMNQRTKERGTIVAVSEERIQVDVGERIVRYPFPDAFASTLRLKDPNLQREFEESGQASSFDTFKRNYIAAVRDEIRYIQKSGGKRYRVFDGQLLSGKSGQYMYSFETDAELHFPDNTQLRIYLEDAVVSAFVISCEEYSIMFQTMESLGSNLEMIEFSADQWMLLEALTERISELNAIDNHIAYEVACRGRSAIRPTGAMILGQEAAINKASSQTVTFIWGPPGTGKTTTLAKIAENAMKEGQRVLMLSYSNVSVDGALLRVAKLTKGYFREGEVIRYGYPRMQELLESDTLTSYQFVLRQNPELKLEYELLLKRKRELKKDDPERATITKRINKIRSKLRDEEKELIHHSAFVATTVSKALSDTAVFRQRFDVVIFDEASMAYIPQVIFAAGLAREHFCCLGDFRQLPAIVQNSENTSLVRDIFEYTYIVEAVENQYGHDWLVMLNLQYRMHPEIADFVSKHMYEGMLRSSHSIYEERQRIAELKPLPRESMGVIDLSDTYSVCVKSSDYSHINLLSAMLSVYIAASFSDSNSVGIITPYNAQSRLILSMIRDLQEKEKKYRNITCATVHQFQGSEKTIIIYDAVDCFRIQYPGVLLTSKKNDTANRLFNVALTRTKGKFLMVVNRDYMKRKRISRDLMFTKTMDTVIKSNAFLYGDELLTSLSEKRPSYSGFYLGERDQKKTWDLYLQDLRNARKEIHIDVPGVFSDDYDALDTLILQLRQCMGKGIKVEIRTDEDVILPEEMDDVSAQGKYVSTPFSIIDREIVWFGQPLAASDFITEGEVIPTKYYPCLRFQGKNTARSIKAFLGF